MFFALLLISGAVCPGMLSIWLFAPQLIEKSVFVFVFLSVSLTLPVVTFNALIFMVTAAIKTHPKGTLSEAAPFGIGIGSLGAMTAFGIPLLVCFLLASSAKTFAYTVALTQIPIAVLCFSAGLTAKPD